MYRERCARFAAQRDRYDRRSHRLANINLLLVTAALVCLGISVWQSAAALALLALLLGLSFLMSYSYHYRVDLRHQRASELWRINNEGLQRLARNWPALPLRLPVDAATDNPTAHDLDLLGHASLYHLLGTASTPVGRQTLQHWLLHPAPDVTARQAAVAELAPLVELRDELALRGRLLGDAPPDAAPFLRWTEGEPWLVQRPWLLWIARVTPLALLATYILQAVGLLNDPWWLIVVAINLGLTVSAGRSVNAITDGVTARQRVFGAYAALFELAARQRFEAPLLQHLQHQLTADGLRANEQMRRLGRIMALADLRSWFFFIVVQLATLWNVHVLWLLERWQRRAGHQVRNWLEALGELEALAALATLSHDHPEWTSPQFVRDGTPELHAQNLGHPLLVPVVCVRNDVALGPPGTFLLVTGSNMSGKSTLLRAIGLNVALAQAGAPVCADALRLPPLVLATSMRVQDSLEQGVSYFMAEIQRLKTVVDQAQQVRAEGSHTLLFLLDEILHGTNTGERQIAARQIIRHLLAQHAIGAVSTHDLTLADDPELAVSSIAVHFRETFTRGPDGPAMHFDYRLRPGIATSTNALKLMELIGLPVNTSQSEDATIETVDS
jgi:predicted ATPase